jgi:hypothetical protein
MNLFSSHLSGPFKLMLNKNFCFFLTSTILFLTVVTIPCFAQTLTAKDNLLKLKHYSDSLAKIFPGEKLYLQTDKPDYAVGDTLWFKAYLLQTPSLQVPDSSSILYVDLMNESGFVNRFRMKVINGICNGNISFNNYKPGLYTLRSYTNWMRNFGEDCFFTKSFTLAGEIYSPPSEIAAEKTVVNVPAIPKTGKNTADGIKNIDIQFLPEGGSLVSSLRSIVGFKALTPDGRGINLSGKILDDRNKEIATISSFYNGMGSFTIQPEAGRSYSAEMRLPGNVYKTYPLPSVKSSGTVLSIDTKRKDSIIISVFASADIAQAGNTYYLIGKSRNTICYGATILINKNGGITQAISKTLFPTGVVHFIILDYKNRPLNERLAFINHFDNLSIEVNSNKHQYLANDSINLNLTVKDISGNPIKGIFSLAVTDDAQVAIDSLADNLLTHMLLSSEIKGNLEKPGYYLKGTSDSEKELDNLLLTQGWVSYDWQPDNHSRHYTNEKNFVVSGKVSSAFGKPLSGVHVSLLSAKPLLAKDTITDNAGHFSFNDFPDIAAPSFILQAVNKKGKSFNVNIQIDDPAPVPFSLGASKSFLDTTKMPTLSIVARNNRIRDEQQYTAINGHLLKEVKIKGKKIIRGSENPNGTGNADFIFDEADLEKQGKKSWLDVLNQNVKGFKEAYFYGKDLPKTQVWLLLNSAPALPLNSRGAIVNSPWFYIGMRPVKFYIDGEPFRNMDHQSIIDFLKSHTAEDIKGIEVSSSSKYSSKYIPTEFGFFVSASDISFIEITTRSGHGPHLDNTPGVYLYKPLLLATPEAFYKPRYNLQEAIGHQPAPHSTINWDPEIVTDANGKAVTNYYGTEGNETYIIEGTDGNGNLGFKIGKIKVSGKKSGQN